MAVPGIEELCAQNGLLVVVVLAVGDVARFPWSCPAKLVAMDIFL